MKVRHPRPHLTRVVVAEKYQEYVAAEITWITANTAIKTSILHFYLTLFHPNRAFRLITYMMMGIVISFCISVLFSTFLLCRPLFPDSLNPAMNKSCGSFSGFSTATNAINLLVDLGIVSLPMPMVWNLQMTRWRKVALSFTFGVGLL